MATKDTNIVKDVRTVQVLEAELQATFTNHSVCVLDVYGKDWGPTKAVSEFFKRLYFEATGNLKFLSVEIEAVLANLKIPVEERGYQRPRNVDHIRETLSDHWAPIFASHVGYSKPLFLFFKEGKMVKEVTGVDAPVLKAAIKDLCAVKTPASDYITNARLLEQWDENFSPDESEVGWEKFLRQLNVMCKLSVPLDEDERKQLGQQLKVPIDGKDKKISAENLMNWVGDDDKTLLQAFTELFPDYDERANKVRIQKEAEDKVKNEKEAVAKAEEDKKKAESDAKAAEETKKREAEEAKLAKDRAAKEQDEISDVRVAELEAEAAKLSDATDAAAEKVKTISPEFATAETALVDVAFFKKVQTVTASRATGRSKERPATDIAVLSGPPVAKIQAVAAAFTKLCSSKKDVLAAYGSALGLSTPQLATLQKALGGGSAVVAQYAFTGDATQLSLEDATTCPAQYPKLYSALADSTLVLEQPELSLLAALWAKAPLLDEAKDAPATATAAFRGAAAEKLKAALVAGANVVFPLLTVTTGEALTGDVVITITGLKGCTALTGGAYAEEVTADWLLPPFTACAVSAVNGGQITLTVAEAPEGADALAAALAACKASLDDADAELSAVGALQAAAISRDQCNAKLATVKAKLEAKTAAEAPPTPPAEPIPAPVEAPPPAAAAPTTPLAPTPTEPVAPPTETTAAPAVAEPVAPEVAAAPPVTEPAAAPAT